MPSKACVVIAAVTVVAVIAVGIVAIGIYLGLLLRSDSDSQNTTVTAKVKGNNSTIRTKCMRFSDNLAEVQ